MIIFKVRKSYFMLWIKFVFTWLLYSFLGQALLESYRMYRKKWHGSQLYRLTWHDGVRRENGCCDTYWMEDEEWDEGMTELSLGECHGEWGVYTVSVQASLYNLINNMTFLNMVIAHVKRQDSRSYVRVVEIFCFVARSITRLSLVEFNHFAGVTFFWFIYSV